MTRAVTGIMAVAFFFTAGVGGQEKPQADVIRIYQEAFEQPFNEARFAAYLSTLPRDEGYYIIEGDLAFTEDEVRTYLVAKSARPARADASPELLLSLDDGRRSFYESFDERRLTYAVDRASFPSEETYQTVLVNFRQAAEEWSTLCAECGIRFTQIGGGGGESGAFLVVRYHDSAGAYVARAFFPHDPPEKRIVRVDPSYFSTSYDRVGVFRHELGHVLGYRHEHIRGIEGCRREGTQWLALTDYDSHSVMHYFCGGGGSPKLEFSNLDRKGHSALYAPPPAAAFRLSPPPPSQKANLALRLFQAAVANPFDDAKRSAYLQSLPRQGGLYIVEGDLRMTEEEILHYLVAQGDAPAPVNRGAELLVNVHDGRRDFYRTPEERNLVYAVDRSSFQDEERYGQVLEDLRQAAGAWMEACPDCGLKFSLAIPQDKGRNQAEVDFTVRSMDSQGAFIAAAFFPHDPPLKRYLDIDPSYFASGLARVGVLRHELGHILGYRHEHIRGVPGCYSEDSGWQPLTKYDPQSVMHYFCGGRGGLSLELTTLDKEGHRKLYGVPQATVPSALIVRFEGGEVSDNVLRVFEVLRRQDLLPLGSHTVAQGESIEAILKRRLGLIGYPAAMDQFVSLLNDGMDPDRLSIGDEVRLPDIQLEPYEFSARLDPKEDRKQLAALEKKWRHVLLTSERRAPDLIRVTLRGYKMTLPVSDLAKLKKAVEQVNALESKNIVVSGQTDSSAQPRYFGHHDASQSFNREMVTSFWGGRQPRMTANLQGALGSLIGEPIREPEWLHPCTVGHECPEIVLIDTPVRPHPDLDGAVFTNSGPLTSGLRLIEGDEQMVEVDNSFDLADHGTHLAGIIGSQDNGFGLVGIHPGVRIYSLNWNELYSRRDDLAQWISDREREAAQRTSFQIYVFATQWPSFDDAERRLTDDTLARKLREERVLVIAAAGQPESGSRMDPDDLTVTYGQAPMNLGDLENVVVVTTCSGCESQTPQIAEWANYSSSGIVHLAAPGEEIPSTIGGGRYAEATGTSQSTAFVAGVASAMACYYPRSYTWAHKLKTRLQVTSRPLAMISSEADAAKIVSGILDAKLALLDPTRDWILWTDKTEMRPLDEPLRWVTPILLGKDRDLRDIPVTLSQVYRIVHRDGSAVFYLDGPAKGQVVRIGPLRLSPGELTRTLFRHGGEDVTLDEFEDLLLATPHRVAQ